MILSFYSIVGGWCLKYTADAATGAGLKIAPEQLGSYFGAFVSDGVSSYLMLLLFLFITAIVVLRGIDKGVERFAKVLMPALFILMIVLIIRGVNVFPSQIEQVVNSFDEITPHYQIVLTTKGTLDQIELRVETAPDFPFDEIRALEDLRKRLAAALKSNLQIAVKIKFCEPKTIERSEGKSKRVIDLREVKQQN